MLCRVGSELDIKNKHLKWFGQRKIDGVRCLAVCNNGFVVLKGRNGTDYTDKFPEIVEELKNYSGGFDGEIVCDTFEHTGSRVHTQNKLKSKLLAKEYPARFVVFDILENKPYKERLEILKNKNLRGCVEMIETTNDLIGLWEKAKKENWEGIVIKNPDSDYAGYCKVRTTNWLKIKYIKSRDILVSKYEINPAGIRVESDVGIALQISGFQHKEVLKEIQETGSCLIEVNYLNETSSGALRMPTFKCKK
jgi:bifunctional non-homologous end joining protein LigD